MLFNHAYRRNQCLLMWVIGGLLLSSGGMNVAMGLTLVVEERACSVIVLPEKPTESESRAAKELGEYIKRISHGELEVVTDTGKLAGRVPIFIGRSAGDDFLNELKTKTQDPAAFVLKVEPDRVRIRGVSDEGTLFGAYELLEQLGVRWFMPGELGTVVPEHKTVELALQSTMQIPSFKVRNMNEARNYVDWGLHMRMGGAWFPSAHGIPLGERRDQLFREHPEYFAMVKGKRVPYQLCITNPEVLKRAIDSTRTFFRQHPNEPWIGMGPNDGGDFCECENCRALDSGAWDPFSNDRVVTDRYIWFFNHVLAGIKDEFPDKKIGFYIYHAYQEPPTKVKADPHIVGALAPIALCRIHGPENPVCPEQNQYARLIGGWSKAISEVYDRGYWFNLADPGFPFIMVHRLRKQIPLAHELGLTGWRVETSPKWAGEMPSLYIASKLMWNCHTDVDALLADFHVKYYGPAAEPMSAYTALMDTALRDGDYHTGGAGDMPKLYPLELRSKARTLLEDAARLAGDKGAYAERVKLTRQSFDYLEAFIGMRDRMTAVDFTGAKTALDRLRKIQDDLAGGYEVPMLSKRFAAAYMDRYWSQAVEQGYARVTSGNERVATFDDQWQFLVDPTGVGESLGWQATGKIGANWQAIRTSSASWSDQGLRYYKGLAWYRQAVHIPARFENRRIFLWFGGVDEKAKVWVNGKLIGVSPGSPFLPFELDATEAIHAGQINAIAVLVNNTVLDELGTGGITAPVMFYAPAAGKDAVLQNIRDLGRTFP